MQIFHHMTDQFLSHKALHYEWNPNRVEINVNHYAKMRLVPRSIFLRPNPILMRDEPSLFRHGPKRQSGLTDRSESNFQQQVHNPDKRTTMRRPMIRISDLS